MKNPSSIAAICEQLEATSCSLRTYAMQSCSIDDFCDEATSKEMQEIALDQLEHIQRLTILLTNLVTEGIVLSDTGNTDEGEGSAFAQGELTDNVGDKTEEADKTGENA